MLPGYRSGDGQVEWQEIKSSELQDYLARATVAPVLLDVRESYQYNQGHIAGAVNIPLKSLEQALEDLDPQRATVTICHSGRKARRAAALLAQHGFTQVGVLLGGMDGWEGPITR
ncbi:MAG: rhodanese-like domain-containing protein [Firmicutes bacterium]|nr:rhodanese-like domain-containing protein [Bacillota bacterium]